MNVQDLITQFHQYAGSPTSLRLHAGPSDIDLADIHDDSRRVTPGSLFIARCGPQQDGAAYIRQAIDAGAVAVLAAAAPADLVATAGPSVAWLVPEPAATVDQALAGRVAEQFFGRPSHTLKLIGVTGTNGKTTTAYLIQHLLAYGGVQCGLIGTIVIDDGRTVEPAELTTPGAVDLSRLLARMVDHGCQAAAIEVSSHALHQGRAAALRFHAAVFTNLTGDHLDYHHTMDAYASAKAVLFEQLDEHGWAVINADDPYASRMAEPAAARKARVVWCSQSKPVANAADGAGADDRLICRAEALDLGPSESEAYFVGPWGSSQLRIPIVGRHNLANALQAIAAANTVTSVARFLRPALAAMPAVPGRLEPVELPEADVDPAKSRSTVLDELPTVLVDYAHTHDALENVLLALRPVTRGKLIVLFGCGGDRDATKRPKMAGVACRLADRVIVTSDNPRTESPQAIIDDIMVGVPDGARGKVQVMLDRADAIDHAIDAAGPLDVVLLAGKGHEDYQIIGTTKRHFDDREQAAAALRRRSHQAGAVE